MEERKSILNAYGEDFHLVESVSETSVSKLYRIESSNGKFVLKQYPPWLNSMDIQFVNDFTQFLARNGLNTPRLIPAIDGGTFVEGEGGIFGIYEYVDGERTKKDKGMLEKAGSTLGSIHKLSSAYSPASTRRWWTVDTYKAEQYFTEAKELMLVRSQKSLIPQLELLQLGYAQVGNLLLDNNKYPQLKRLIIHGDFDDRNTMVVDGEIHVVDFDNAREEIREMDLADLLRYFCGIPNKGWKDKAKIFVSGYNKESELNDLDSGAIVACLLMSSLQEGCWQFRQSLKVNNEGEHVNLMNLELIYLESILSNQGKLERELEQLS